MTSKLYVNKFQMLNKSIALQNIVVKEKLIIRKNTTQVYVFTWNGILIQRVP